MEPVDQTDLIVAGGDKLSASERFHIRFVQKSLEHGWLNDTLRWCQRTIGATWINASTSNTLELAGLERLPAFDPAKSYICVANHRSFFDMYVVFAYLVARGLPHRLIFPVRSNFFYDNPLGFFVNGAMSFFAMYPPMFRQAERRDLNSVGLSELSRVLNAGGAFCGFHPEGTRSKTDDPYTLLPPKLGIGRLVHESRVTVVPVFINGLTNSIREQVMGNVTRRGERVIAVFGEPIDFGTMLDQPKGPAAYRAIAEETLRVVSALGQEEKALRARPRAT